MGSVPLWKGGTPVIEFMHCKGHTSEFTPPFGLPNYEFTPPFDAHADNAYGAGGYFTDGLPINPNWAGMEWQAANMRAYNPGVGDILRCYLIPCNHYLEMVRFDVNNVDANLAGATVIMTVEQVTKTADGEFVFTEVTAITDAATDQGKAAPIPLDTPSSRWLSLRKLSSGGQYTEPLMSEPTFETDTDGHIYRNQECGYMVGLKIVALPTDTNITLDMMNNDWYLTVKFAEFECAGFK